MHVKIYNGLLTVSRVELGYMQLDLYYPQYTGDRSGFKTDDSDDFAKSRKALLLESEVSLTIRLGGQWLLS